MPNESFISYLKSLGEIHEHTINELASIFFKAELKRNDYFIHEGEIAHEIGFLEEGIVRAYYVNNEGKEYTKNLFAAPSIIGSYVSLITGLPNKLPQQALTDCIVWKASFTTIKKLAETHFDVERLRRIIAENFFIQKEKREIEMALLDAEKRYKIFQKEYPGVELQINQYHIASFLGISATQLSRIRNKLAGKQ